MRNLALLLVFCLLAAGEMDSAGKAKANDKTKPSASQKSAANPGSEAPKPASKPSANSKDSGSSGQGKSAAVPSSDSAASKTQQTAADSTAEGYTSLLVDVTGFKLGRSMCPKILRADGNEVWGTLKNLKDEDYDFLQEHGMVAYVTTVQEAHANERCGTRPLVVKAIRTDGRDHSCVVVSDEDSARILGENHKSAFLDKFRVIFIKNDNPPPACPSENSVQQNQPANSQARVPAP